MNPHWLQKLQKRGAHGGVKGGICRLDLAPGMMGAGARAPGTPSNRLKRSVRHSGPVTKGQFVHSVATLGYSVGTVDGLALCPTLLVLQS